MDLMILPLASELLSALNTMLAPELLMWGCCIWFEAELYIRFPLVKCSHVNTVWTKLSNYECPLMILSL